MANPGHRGLETLQTHASRRAPSLPGGQRPAGNPDNQRGRPKR